MVLITNIGTSRAASCSTQDENKNKEQKIILGQGTERYWKVEKASLRLYSHTLELIAGSKCTAININSRYKKSACIHYVYDILKLYAETH